VSFRMTEVPLTPIFVAVDCLNHKYWSLLSFSMGT
jgi:hypothetical protein